MPMGNGDITANLWVENNGGDLLLYIGKSDTWSEGTRLLKVGRTRMHFTPNPFATGAPFSQTLDLYHGEIDITAGQPGSQVYLRVWIDANQPVIRLEASGDQNFSLTCSNEVWRNSTYTLPSSGDPNAASFRGVTGGPTLPSESADNVASVTNLLMWYHRNTSSFYQTILTGENLANAWNTYPDPYLNRTFGATIKGSNFTTLNNYTLQSSAGTNFLLSIYPYTAQSPTATIWQIQLSNLVAQVDLTDIGTARSNHYNWWDAFWNRSWIFASGDSNATNVTRGYLLQRFMEACQGRGNFPMKFNGGTFTFDYNGQNGDYRTWGPGCWHQNTRHMYWPLLASGDFDLMMPFFNCYTNMLGLQTNATARYYAHGGGFFPETFNFFGAYLLDDWGWGRSNQTSTGNTYIKYHYQGGLETLGMMLTYYDYTRDGAFATNYIVPFATQVIRFFDQHWPRVNGKIKFYPANALEMYWSCTNSADYISGLMDDIPRLMSLPTNYTTPALLGEWSNCLSSLPPLPMDAGGTRILPAQTYGAANNAENPECYCIFPYRIYGLGRPNLPLGVSTFVNRTIQNNKKCWSQDVIQEPLVGLTSAAQADVILNFTDADSECRFPAFWTSNHDYLPDLDNGGAAMTGLQFMLLQCNGSQIMPLPSWPLTWDVDFKLCAPSNTSVRLVLQNGSIAQLTVTPASRSNDLFEATAPPPTGLTAYPGNGQIGLYWTASTGASAYNIKRSTTNGGPYAIVAPGVTNLNYIDTGLSNGSNYYYVVSATNLWGDGSNSLQASVTPATNVGVRWEGDLIANLQSADLISTSKTWTNRNSNSNSVGNFATVGGANLNVANVAYGTGSIKALFVNSVGNNAVQSALTSPTAITGANPVSAEVWAYATSVAPTSATLNYGYQTNSHDRDFNYDTSGHGAVSGYNADTSWVTTPTTGAWHYLVYTYDGTTFRAYSDGNLDVTAGRAWTTQPTFVSIGADIGGMGVNAGNDPFKGYIAAARVESGILTIGDIAANYAAGPLASATAITPTGLAAVPGDSLVTLNWSGSANAAGYNLKRAATSNGVYSIIATNLPTTAFTNASLSNGTLYYFTVSATNSAGESANSPAIGARPVSFAPLQVSFVATNGQIIFAWPPDHAGWRLQIQTNSAAAGLGTNWLTVSDSMLTNQMSLPAPALGSNAFFRLIYP